MKRGTALTCALMIVMMNMPAASAERNIVSTIRGADYAISVDADVYGEGTSGLQAYRVQTLDWGRNPETHFDLSLWFDADVPTEKADFDCTVFYPKGDETRLGERDEARFSPYGVSFMRATDARLTFPLDKWNYRRMQENPNAVQLPQGFALTDAAESILPIAEALGVEVERRPVFVSVMTLADWQAETRQKLDRGVAPDERVIEDWTADDESVQLNFRQLFHGLPMLETDAHMPGILEWETSLTMVSATVSRRGLERLDFPFVAGEEEAVGAPFSAISPEEALEACEKADLNLDGWQNLRVSRLELGYVMLAQNLAQTEIDARPAWLIRIWGEIFGETESIAVAVDAQTGNILAM